MLIYISQNIISSLLMSVLKETKIHLRVNVNRKSHIAGSSNKWNLYTYIFDIFYKCNTCYFVTWLMTRLLSGYVTIFWCNFLIWPTFIKFDTLISYSWKASLVKRELRGYVPRSKYTATKPFPAMYIVRSILNIQ